MDSHTDSVLNRLDVVDTGRRRRWSDGEKERIVLESMAGPRHIDRGDVASIQQFRDNLRASSQAFDVCVIDTPPSLGLRSVAALVAASHVLSPIYRKRRSDPTFRDGA